MSDVIETASATEILARPEAMLRVPVGFASPLWGFFAGAAMSGSAWWWMTRFARVENLEAMFGAAEAGAMRAAALPMPAAEAMTAAALETLDVVEETADAVEPGAEAVVEAEVAVAAGSLEDLLADAPPAPILEAMEAMEAMEAAADAPAPVGGESAAISPVVEAFPAADPESAAGGPDATAEVEAGSAKSRRKAAPPKAD
ncbi:MAG: hypothetical protein JSS35_16340 [Proteobacteria bacterium]|nr:hypothetical protein [Pseudomonadota bacterium]